MKAIFPDKSGTIVSSKNIIVLR